MNNYKPILYAEDDENDVYLMERAFSKLNFPNPLQVAGDGKLAIAYLAGSPPYEDRAAHPLPCLLLMDLSMPGRHGLNVLAWIKQQPHLAELPVIIFSSSNQESDIRRAYELGADGFMVKPGDPQVLQLLLAKVQEYWLSETRPEGTFLEFARLLIIPPPKAVLA